jgi:hypothetical protein
MQGTNQGTDRGVHTLRPVAKLLSICQCFADCSLQDYNPFQKNGVAKAVRFY